jgi:hypothetical protein
MLCRRKQLICAHFSGHFSIATSFDASSSNHNISEGNLCSKTQNAMFPYCSVANIFKRDKQTICRNKQTADTWSQQCLWWQNLLWIDIMNATNSWHWNILRSIIHLKKLSNSGNFLRKLLIPPGLFYGGIKFPGKLWHYILRLFHKVTISPG